jgi:Zn-dependent protease with chaperone function
MEWARVTLPIALLAAAGCSTASAPSPDHGQSRAPAATSRSAPAAQRVDTRDAVRVSRLMVPLIRAADHPRPLDQIRVGIVDDPSINAGSAGNGQYIVTRGLLEQANDEQLQAVLAHEVAHDDLNHVARLQRLGTGLQIGAVILDQIFPGSGQITPIAGELAMRAYSRPQEIQADKHGAEILRRVGSSRDAMTRTLEWLKAETGGGSKGGFFSSHPGTDERIEALRRMQ